LALNYLLTNGISSSQYIFLAFGQLFKQMFCFWCLPNFQYVISMRLELNRITGKWLIAGFLALLAGCGVYFGYGAIFAEPILLLNPAQKINVQGTTKIRVEFDIAARVDVELTHIESNCDCVSFGVFPQKFAKGERRKIVADVDLTKIKSLPAQRIFVFYTNPLCDRRPVAVIDFFAD
jgi:hypothetical protein